MPDNRNVHYEFTGDATSLKKAADEALNTLVAFEKSLKVTSAAAGTAFDSTAFNKFSDGVLDSISSVKLLQKQFKEFSKLYGSIDSRPKNVIDQYIAAQQAQTKSARESFATIRQLQSEQEANAKRIAKEQEQAAKQASRAQIEAAKQAAKELKAQERAQTKVSSEAKNTKSSFDKLKSSLSGIVNQMKSLHTETKFVSSAFSSLTNVISGAVLGSALANATKESIDYVENLNLFKVAMHDSIEEGQTFIATMAEMYGLDPSYLAKTTGLFYEMAYAVDVPADAASKLSLNLTALSSDLASLFNKDFGQVSDNLTSGIRGMSRAVVKYGLDLRASTVEAYALSHGITEQFETMSEANREILRYLVILEQSTDAQGDFARTIESPANQLRVFKEQVVQFGRAIGNFIVAPLASVLPYVNGFIMAIRTIIEGLAELLGFMTWTSNSTSDLGDSLEETTNGVAGIGSAASDSAKELKGMLAPFDELNVISESAAADAGGAGGVGGGSMDLVDPRLLELLDESSYKLQEVKMKATEVRDAILAFMGIRFWQEFDDATGRMITKLEYIPEVFEENLIKKFPEWEQSIRALFDVNWNYAFYQLQEIAKLIGEIAKMTLGNIVDDILALFGVNDTTLAESIRNINGALLDLRYYLAENKEQIASILTFIGEAVIAFNLFRAVAGLLAPILGALGTAFLTISSIGPTTAAAISTVSKVFEPLTKVVGGIVGQIATLGAGLQNTGTLVGGLGTKVSSVFGTMLSSVGTFSTFFTTVFTVGIVAAIVAIVAAFVNWFATTEEGHAAISLALQTLGSIFQNLGELIGIIIGGIIKAIQWLSTEFSSVFNSIAALINNVLGILDGLLDFLIGVFTGDWDRAWSGLYKVAANAFAAIGNFIGGVLNAAITLIENALNFIGDSFLYFIKSIVSAIPIVGDKYADKIPESFNIELPRIPAINFDVPELATGGVVTSPTYLMAGEAGRSEAVIPLDNSPQMLDFIEQIADKVGNQEPAIVKVYIGDKEWDTFTYQSAQRGEKLSGVSQVKVSR